MDRDLVERARKADREAFAVLVHQDGDSLYAIAYALAGLRVALTAAAEPIAREGRLA